MKDKQKKILIELLNENVELKPFNVAFLREITDMYELGEISYGRMVEMLNEIAINWFEKQKSFFIKDYFKDGVYNNNIFNNVYPIVICSNKHRKLLAFQSKPTEVYYFKDKEVSIEELIDILENAKEK